MINGLTPVLISTALPTVVTTSKLLSKPNAALPSAPTLLSTTSASRQAARRSSSVSAGGCVVADHCSAGLE